LSGHQGVLNYRLLFCLLLLGSVAQATEAVPDAGPGVERVLPSFERVLPSLERVLHSLDLDRLLPALQPVVSHALAQAPDAPIALQQLITSALAVAPLQQALSVELERTYRPGTYGDAVVAVEDPAVKAVLAACETLPGEDLGAQLTAYQVQLATRSPRPVRTQLARRMDSSARTSSIAASLYSSVEHLIAELTRPQFSADVPWSEVASVRAQALQQSVVTWYLYCGRASPDDALRYWLARYDEKAVQQVLDDVENALSLVLQRITLDLARQASQLENGGDR
jgi:hypothetical protein